MSDQVRPSLAPSAAGSSLPTLAALRQARASREALLRRILPIGFGALVIVVVATSRAKPGAGLHGASLGVTLALAGFALAAIGGFAALVVHRTGAWLLVPVLILLMVSSSVLVWLQPDGAGPVGLLIAVGVAARIIPGRTSVVMLTVCLGFLLVAESLSHGRRHQGTLELLVNALPLAAIYMIVLLPDVEVIGTAADGEEVLALAAELRPDVILMDLRMPRMDGVEATRRLRERDPGVKVVVLTTYADDRSVLDALRAGALGYLTKDAGAAEIQQALHRVAGGQAALDPAVQLHLVEAIAEGVPAGPDPAPLPDGLTPREAEVLTLIAAGLSNAEIAERLVVSEATVKSHVNHMLAKIGARDRAQAVGYAYRHGQVHR